MLLLLFSNPQAGRREKDKSGQSHKWFLSYLKQAISCSLLKLRLKNINLGAVKLSWRGQSKRPYLCLAEPGNQSSGALHPSATRLLITSPLGRGELSAVECSCAAAAPERQTRTSAASFRHSFSRWHIYWCWKVWFWQLDTRLADVPDTMPLKSISFSCSFFPSRDFFCHI